MVEPVNFIEPIEHEHNLPPEELKILQDHSHLRTLSDLFEAHVSRPILDVINMSGHTQFVLNDVAGAIRAIHRFIVDASNQGFIGTKIGTFASLPWNALSAGNELALLFTSSPELSDKALHFVFLMRELGDFGNNLWTGFQGIDIFAHVGPVMNVLNVAGPIAWTVGSVGGIAKVAHNWYVSDKILGEIRALNKPVETPLSTGDHNNAHHIQVLKYQEEKRELRAVKNQLKIFELFLRDANGKELSESEVHSKLNLMGRIPFFESKTNLRGHIHEIASKYAITQDEGIAGRFRLLVKRQYTVNKVLNVVKITAFLTALVAVGFFYIPVLKDHLAKYAWFCVIAANVLGVGIVIASKANSIMFSKKIEKMAKELRAHKDDEYSVEFVEDMLKIAGG